MSMSTPFSHHHCQFPDHPSYRFRYFFWGGGVYALPRCKVPILCFLGPLCRGWSVVFLAPSHSAFWRPYFESPAFGNFFPQEVGPLSRLKHAILARPTSAQHSKYKRGYHVFMTHRSHPFQDPRLAHDSDKPSWHPGRNQLPLGGGIVLKVCLVSRRLVVLGNWFLFNFWAFHFNEIPAFWLFGAVCFRIFHSTSKWPNNANAKRMKESWDSASVWGYLFCPPGKTLVLWSLQAPNPWPRLQDVWRKAGTLLLPHTLKPLTPPKSPTDSLCTQGQTFLCSHVFS